MELDGSRGDDALSRPALMLDEGGAQDRVACRQHRQRLAERANVERTSNMRRERHVVGDAVPVLQSVDEPHPLLVEGQRPHPVGQMQHDRLALRADLAAQRVGQRPVRQIDQAELFAVAAKQEAFPGQPVDELRRIGFDQGHYSRSITI